MATQKTSTSLIVNEFIRSQLHEKGYEWNAPQSQSKSSRSLSDQEREICRGLSRLAVNYSSFIRANRHSSQFSKVISLFDDLHPEQAYSTFVSLSNELFADGIQRSYIITFLMIGAELAYNCVEQNNEQMIDHVAEWITSYINDNLSNWIKNNRGWKGIIELVPENETSGPMKTVFRGFALGVACLSIYLMSSMDKIIDCLAYVDRQYESEHVRKRVMDLIDSEVRQSDIGDNMDTGSSSACTDEFVTDRMRQESKRISDGHKLSDLVSIPNDLPRLDNKLDNLIESCDKLKVIISHMNEKCARVESDNRHGAEAWKSYLNTIQQARQKLYPGRIESTDKQQQEINWKRKGSQTKTAQKLAQLELKLQEQIDKNRRIEAACEAIGKNRR